jgi:hypothetical protein
MAIRGKKVAQYSLGNYFNDHGISQQKPHRPEYKGNIFKALEKRITNQNLISSKNIFRS